MQDYLHCTHCVCRINFAHIMLRRTFNECSNTATLAVWTLRIFQKISAMRIVFEMYHAGGAHKNLCSVMRIKNYLPYGVKWESNPRPLAPKARIMPLDHWPVLWFMSCNHNKRREEKCVLRVRAPRIELGTHCVLGNCHNQLDQARV